MKSSWMIETPTRKYCNSCHKEKLLQKFYRHKRGGYRSYCKECDKDRANDRHMKIRLEKLGVDQTIYNQMQRRPCSICKHRKKIVVDHDHATGKIRGPLCWRCNVGIGHFYDKPQLLISAAQYLMAWQLN